MERRFWICQSALVEKLLLQRSTFLQTSLFRGWFNQSPLLGFWSFRVWVTRGWRSLELTSSESGFPSEAESSEVIFRVRVWSSDSDSPSISSYVLNDIIRHTWTYVRMPNCSSNTLLSSKPKDMVLTNLVPTQSP